MARSPTARIWAWLRLTARWRPDNRGQRWWMLLEASGDALADLSVPSGRHVQALPTVADRSREEGLHACGMEPVIEETTGGDVQVRTLVAAQEAEVMTRYGVDDAGPGLAVTTPCLLARLGERPVGCVALGRLGDGVGEVKRMYVDPSARGHRIGRLLLRSVEELAARQGYRRLRLETGTEQPEALRLYDSAGWSRIDCYGYFKDDPSTICYEKTIQY